MTYTTPDAAVAAALDALRQDYGWSALSTSIARYLLAKKAPALAMGVGLLNYDAFMRRAKA